MTTRSALIRSLSTDEATQLLQWFVESYDDGWRPVMESHVASKSGRYTPIGVDALREKAREVVDQLTKLDQR